MDEDEITKIIVGAAREVHKLLGPGLLESAYEPFLRSELLLRGLEVRQSAAMFGLKGGMAGGLGGRVDLLVEDKVLIEIKSVESLDMVQCAQVSTDLQLLQCRLGLLINFNVREFGVGVKRIFNHGEE